MATVLGRAAMAAAPLVRLVRVRVRVQARVRVETRARARVRSLVTLTLTLALNPNPCSLVTSAVSSYALQPLLLRLGWG